MKKTITFIILTALLIGCSDHTKDKDEDDNHVKVDTGKTIATVNGREISETRLSVYATIAPGQDTAAVLDNIITSELIAQAAKEAKIHRQPDIVEQLEVARQTVLGRAYAQQFLAENQVDDAALQARYGEFKKSFEDTYEYQTAHILIDDEQKAKDVYEQVVADNEQFAALAQEHSIDPGSASQGGSLGWVAPQALVPEYAQAMQTIEPGNIAESPVKTQFGWHIIRVDDKRPVTIPSLSDALREQLEQTIQAEKFTKHLEDLRSTAEVVRH